MMRLSMKVFCVSCLVSSVASASSRSEKRGHTRGHHTEQSVVVVAEAPTPAPALAGTVTVGLRSELQESTQWDGGLMEGASGAVPDLPWMEEKKKRQAAREKAKGGDGVEVAEEEKKEVKDDDDDDSMKAEAEVMTGKTSKAEFQRKLVALIWLERVLQQNLDSMEEENYRAKIGSGKAALEKDSTPATAEMLARMRTEMHEFSVPFFQKAVKDELKDVRARQKVLLDKIIAIDAGQDPDDVVGDDGSTPPAPKKKEAAKTDKKEKPKLTAEQLATQASEKAARHAQSEMFIFIMSAIAGLLIIILLAVAIKVRTHEMTT